jgi:hypothetical protein
VRIYDRRPDGRHLHAQILLANDTALQAGVRRDQLCRLAGEIVSVQRSSKLLISLERY